jgi:hypothetical protein
VLALVSSACCQHVSVSALTLGPISTLDDVLQRTMPTPKQTYQPLVIQRKSRWTNVATNLQLRVQLHTRYLSLSNMVLLAGKLDISTTDMKLTLLTC